MTAVSVAMLEKGTTLADYRVDGVLGRGGMGTVYEATQLSLGRKVALKVLASHLSNDPAFRARFHREGRAQAALEHEHIVTVHEAGETEYGLFLSMRLVHGCNLKDLILAGELCPWRAMYLLAPIGDALDMAHARGVIHRDVKPQNILVDGCDHPYLADFGLIRTRAEASLTEPGHFIGTCDYVSPEQVCGERVGEASDLYSLAAVMYECLTGVAPYPKDSEMAVLYAHVYDPAPKVTAVRPELPADLDAVIARGMANTPEERYGSVGEFMEEAGRALGGGPHGRTRLSARPARPSTPVVSAAPTAGLVAADRLRHGRAPRRARATVLTAAILLLAPGVGYVAGRAMQEQAPPAASVGRDYARAMKQTMAALNAARLGERGRMRAASTRAAQGRAASALAADHEAAARSVRRLAASPALRPAHAAVAGALVRTAAGYAAMASAARDGRPRAYGRGGDMVRGGERALEHARERLVDAGGVSR